MNVDLFSGQLIRERPKQPKARLMAGGSRKKENKKKYDFFPTPEGAVKEIVDRELLNKVPDYYYILEPASGEGHIVRVLEGYGFDNLEYSDIRETEFSKQRGIKLESFLLRSEDRKVNTVITNPPFSLTVEFIKKAKEIAINKVILLLPLAYLAGQRRYRELWSEYVNEEFPLKKVYVFSYRLDFEEGDPPPFELAWYVWEKGASGKAEIEWIY